MSQLSENTASSIGPDGSEVFWTLDGTESAPIARVQFVTAGWSPLKNTEDDCLESVEVQQVDVGGDDGTDGFEVVLKAPVLRASVYAKFRAQRETAGTVYAGHLVLAERDEADAERVLDFERLAYVSLDFDRTKRIAAGYVFDVVATLRSVK